MTNPQKRDDNKGIYKKERKGPGQSQIKTTSVNYMISNEVRRDVPKITKPKMQFKSQNREISGQMKKKQKVKKFEYLRDPHQGQNFQ